MLEPPKLFLKGPKAGNQSREADNDDVYDHRKDEKHLLDISAEVFQIDDIQPSLCASADGEEESVNCAQLSRCDKTDEGQENAGKDVYVCVAH